MKHSPSSFYFLLSSSLLAILIWMISPGVKSYVKSDIAIFPIADYEARYMVSWHGMSAGESVHRLHRRENGQFHFEVRTEPKLRFLPYHYVESSDFAWESGKIVPQNYYYNIHEGKRRKKGNVVFDWENKKLHLTKTEAAQEMPLNNNMHDKLTQGLSLRYTLKAGQPEYQYSVAEADKIKNYNFKLIGEETIQTHLGLLHTLKIEHISKKGHQTISWLSTKHDYLPVKMIQYRQGTAVATGEIIALK